MAIAAVKGYQGQGMIVTGKHYPGFGESAVDSHIGMVYLNCDEKLLFKRELYPYLKTIREAKLSGVMTGHIMVPKIDPKYPASISNKLIGILRNKLKFDGLIMTDSLAMVGMTNLFGLEECHGLAMAAGNDMVMTSYRIPTKEAYDYMMKAYKKGLVSLEQIDNAVRRVLAAQAKTLKAPEQKALTEKDRAIVVSISEKAITALLSEVKSAVIPAKDKHLFVLQVENSFTDPQTGKPFRDDPGGAANIENIIRIIKEQFPNSAIWKINDYPHRDQIEEALAESMKYDSVVMVAFSRTMQYTGSSDISQRLMAFISGVSHKLSCIILFGNAHAAREFPKVPRIIFGYEGGNSIESAFKVLSGKIKPTGKIPVHLFK
ncbi:MAG: hypothetical protein A2297_05060 [Elusimicrobia bacterium RIFOXYB2_FULL_48_7]|nr:MAG: hypothetical protein A2297_05060 [Elusimicrobia bacterium RIFOXYB2_FULL_48_7]